MSQSNTIFCPVILAGGGGTRLWPLSREQYPKQFLSFGNNHSMLQQTLARVSALKGDLEMMPPVLISNEEHRFLVREHAEMLGSRPAEIILEPAGRNTAPALTIVALKHLESDPVLLVAPADHLITDGLAFMRAVSLGMVQAGEGRLVTFGIRPSRPDTGYGYIQTASVDDNAVRKVSSFVEKPDEETAKKYLQSGNYSWNSGIFMMRASVWLHAIDRFRHDIASACKDVLSKSTDRDGFFYLDKSFMECPADSIDYAVMERLCGNDEGYELVMIETDPGWTDLGSWEAVYEINSKDENNNVTDGNVLLHETVNSIVQSNSRLIATFGCDNVLVIETPDAVLVGNRQKSQAVKQVVEKLKHEDRPEAIAHRRVYRPWGSYETLDEGENFQVKRLVVNPGKKLSLQLHHKRAEHWVVVKGIATVTCGDKVFDLDVNESTYIPLGAKHRLENRQQSVLEVIEVQSGSYLGEDDIVRFDDDFGRHK